MGEVVELNNSSKITPVDEIGSLSLLTDNLLADARVHIKENKTISVPLAELSTLGTGISSMIPAFNTIIQTTTMPTDGLFRIANAAVGDTLKMAKNGYAWGAMKTAVGSSKMVQLVEVGSLSATTQTIAAFNPVTIMMAATLYSIEKQLSDIAETEKQILSFLEIEKESAIEADVETLSELITNYKYNWNNDVYVASSHKMVMDIKRKARSSMISYQKEVEEIVSMKKILSVQNQVHSVLNDMEKKFKYYRLSLYTFSLASMMEIMLGGNYSEEYITGIKDEIVNMSSTYRDLFDKGSVYLEKLGNSSVETNVLKGIGTAGKAVGKFIGNIPLVKEGPVDEFLVDRGSNIKKTALGIEKRTIHQFAAISNPGTGVFIQKMDDVIQIYNHTEQICFDRENIYLITN